MGLGLTFTLWGEGSVTEFNAKWSHKVAPPLTGQGCWLRPQRGNPARETRCRQVPSNGDIAGAGADPGQVHP